MLGLEVAGAGTSGPGPSQFQISVQPLLLVDGLRNPGEGLDASDGVAQVEEDGDQEDHDQDEEDAQDNEVRPVADHHDAVFEAPLLAELNGIVVFWPRLALMIFLEQGRAKISWH